MYRVLAGPVLSSQPEREKERENVYSDTRDFLSHCFEQQAAEKAKVEYPNLL